MHLKNSPKTILFHFISILPQINTVFKGNDQYKIILDFLNTKDWQNDENLHLIKLKEVEKDTGLSAHKLRKYLNVMYDKLFDYENDFTFGFNKPIIYFHATHFKNSIGFKCTDLMYLPRIGENMTVYFLKAKIGTDYFYVEDIRHEFELNQQLIYIMLKGGSFNSYWHHRKHKARELKELGPMDEYNLNDYELKTKLGIRF